eukprot:ANDGO_07606.mRNA.1 putative RNA-binding protein C1827.05c
MKKTTASSAPDVIPIENAAMQPSSVIYIGRLPSAFSEEPLKKFLSQFGDISRLRVSRNRHTGKSKHYAFVEFADAEVASIVAETMNNYLLENHILQCSVLLRKDVHTELFKGSGKPFAALPTTELHANRVNRKRSREEENDHVEKLLKSESAKRSRIQKAGIEYDFPGYANAKKSEKPSASRTADKSVTKHAKKTESKPKASAMPDRLSRKK